MKMIFVTYEQNGVKKKATLNETLYEKYSKDTTIKNLIVYPSALLMEQNYSNKTVSSSAKKFLHD